MKRITPSHSQIGTLETCMTHTGLHHAVILRHIRDATIQPQSESFVRQHDAFLHRMETRRKPSATWNSNTRVVRANPTWGLVFFPSFHIYPTACLITLPSRTHSSNLQLLLVYVPVSQI